MSGKNKTFFFRIAVLLILLVVSGFSLAAFQRLGGPVSIPLYLHLHGAVFLGWFVLTAVQARLIQTGGFRVHKCLGTLSVLLAISILLIGYIVTYLAFDKPNAMIAGRPALYGSVFPFTDILNFSVMYVLGILHRHNAGAHKRFMLLAGILMIEPAIARLVLGFGLPPGFFLVLELSLLAAVISYDWTKLRRPHWASVFGLLFYCITTMFKLNVQQVGWWPDFAAALFFQTLN